MDNFVVVPTYGCKGLLEATLTCLITQDIGSIKILVVDNSPTPHDLTYWTRDGRVTQMSFPSNLGVGASWNLGMRWALSRGAEYLLVVNHDVVLRPDTYRLLLEPLGGFVSGVGVHTSPEVHWKDPLAIGIFPKLRGGPDFSCFVIKKAFYEAVGPFDECFYPAYREDNSYHWRAKCAGRGDEIFSVSVPYLHVNGGSAAIKENPGLKALNDSRWQKNGDLYQDMWGGPPGREIYKVPFDGPHSS